MVKKRVMKKGGDVIASRSIRHMVNLRLLLGLVRNSHVFSDSHAPLHTCNSFYGSLWAALGP